MCANISRSLFILRGSDKPNPVLLFIAKAVISHVVIESGIV